MGIQYDPADYDMPWRRNYELMAAGVWLSGAAGYGVYAAFGSFPAGPLLWIAGGMGLFGVHQLRKGLRLMHLQLHLAGTPLPVCTFDELRKICGDPAHRDEVWLGKGFLWGPTHTQRIMGILRRDWQQIVKDALGPIYLWRFLKKHRGQILRSPLAARHAYLEEQKSLSEKGQPWIHGVGGGEDNIFQPISHTEGHTLVIGTTGSGKAQPAASKVLTPFGWRTLGSLRPGDFVVSWRGEPARVEQVFDRGIRESWLIKTSDGRRTEACEEHLWTVWLEPPVCFQGIAKKNRRRAALRFTAICDPDGRRGLAAHLRACGVADDASPALAGEPMTVTTRLLRLLLRLGWKAFLPAYSPDQKRPGAGLHAMDADCLARCEALQANPFSANELHAAALWLSGMLPFSESSPTRMRAVGGARCSGEEKRRCGESFEESCGDADVEPYSFRTALDSFAAKLKSIKSIEFMKSMKSMESMTPTMSMPALAKNPNQGSRGWASQPRTVVSFSFFSATTTSSSASSAGRSAAGEPPDASMSSALRRDIGEAICIQRLCGLPHSAMLALVDELCRIGSECDLVSEVPLRLSVRSECTAAVTELFRLCGISVQRSGRALCVQRKDIRTGREDCSPLVRSVSELTRCVRVETVASTGERKPMRCIKLADPEENDELYVTDDCMVTHNTRCFDLLISQAILRGECVIIIDPKGDTDLKNKAQRACEALGRKDAFVMFHPAHTEESAHINLLANWTRPTELASRIANLIQSTGQSDPFKNFSWDALNKVAQGLCIAYEKPSIMNLRRYLESSPEELFEKAFAKHILHSYGDAGQRIIEKLCASCKRDSIENRVTALINYYLQHGPDDPALDGLISLRNHDKEHFGKMVTSLLPILSQLTSGKLGRLLSPSDDPDEQGKAVFRDTGDFIEKNAVVYMGLDSLSDNMVGSAIGSLMLADLTAAAGSIYNFKEKRRIVNVFVDEAAECVNDSFIQLLNKGRGAKFKLVVATQTISDFAARLGSMDKAMQVIGNLNNTISLRCIDQKTQEFVTRRFPKTKVKSIAIDQGLSTSADNPLPKGGRQGERLTEEEADLFPAELLNMLPDLEFIANLSGGKVVKGRYPFLVQDKSEFRMQ